MWTRLRNALRALLARDPGLDGIQARLDAIEAAHATLAQTVAEQLEDRLIEGDKLYKRVQSALGRIYRLKGWDDADAEEAAAAAPGEGQRPALADVIAAKFKRN